MKSTIYILGEAYDSRQTIVEDYDISYSTVQNWNTRGILPAKRVKIGKTTYYCRTQLEANLLKIGGHHAPL
jgi:hypothetical protein